MRLLIIICLFSLSIGTANAQYDCSSPIVISSLPYIANNLTTSTGASYQASGVCDDNYNEQDYIFYYSPIVEEQLKITVFLDDSFIDAGIYVFTGCAQPPTNCVAFEPHNVGDGEIDLVFGVVPGNDYYIFIGTEGTENFNIEISKEEVIGVAINKSEPTQTLDVNGSLRISESQDIPYEGTLKWNDTDKLFQGFDGTSWKNLRTQSLNDLIDAKYNESSNSLSIPKLANLGNNNVIYGSNVGIGNGFISGYSNSLFGSNAGRSVTSGSFNVILGSSAGANASSTAIGNVFIGHSAGSNDNGTSLPNNDGNIFIGFRAGYGFETSNKLVIDNNDLLGSTNFSPPLIYGDFENNFLLINRSSRLNGETFGVNGNSQAHIIVNSATGTIKEPSYRFAKSNIETAKITNTFFATLSFEYKGLNGIAQNIEFNGNGEIEQFAPVASKSTPGEWSGNSDERLKKNIAPLNSLAMLEKVRQMRGVEYEWNDKSTAFNRPKGKQIGFIAQDLQRIFPEKIKEDEDGFLLAAYGTYDPVIVEAIKALANQVDDQKEVIENQKAALEAQSKLINELANRLDKMEEE
jgi:hypothetical protein